MIAARVDGAPGCSFNRQRTTLVTPFAVVAGKRARRYWQVGVVALQLWSCARSAVPQNGAFVEQDVCNLLVLEAIAEDEELRWVQRHIQLGEGEFCDTAEGYASTEGVHPVQVWMRYHREPKASTKVTLDTLTHLIWETQSVTLQRKVRTELVSSWCTKS